MSNLGEPITIEELLDNAKAMDLSHLAVFFDINTTETYAKPISDLKDLLQTNFVLEIEDITGLQDVADDVVTNTSDISTNTTNISTNAVNIQTNADDIDAIELLIPNFATLDGIQTLTGKKTFAGGIVVDNPEDIEFSVGGNNLQDELDSLSSAIGAIDLSQYLTESSSPTITSTWYFDTNSYIYTKLPSQIYFEDYNGVGSGDDLGNILSQFLTPSSSPTITSSWTFDASSYLYLEDPSYLSFNDYQSGGPQTLDTILSNFLTTDSSPTIDGPTWTFGSGSSLYVYDPSNIYFDNLSNDLGSILSGYLNNTDDQTISAFNWYFGTTSFNIYDPSYIYFSNDTNSLADRLNTLQTNIDNITIDLSNYTDPVDFGNTVNFNDPAAITFDSGDDLQDIIDNSISAIDFSNYVTLDSSQSITGAKNFNGDVNFNDNIRFYHSSNFYKRINIGVNDSSLQSLYGSLFKTSDGHNGYPIFTEDYGQIDENDPTSPYPSGEKTAYLGPRHASYIYDKDFLEDSNISGDQLDALNHSFIRSLTIPFYNVYSIPHSLVMLDFTGNISDAGNEIELFGVTFSLTEAGNSLSQLVTDLNNEFDTYEDGGINDGHANAESIAKLRAVSYTDTAGTYADPGDELLYILSDLPERLYVTARSEFNLVGVNDVTNYSGWNLQSRKPQFDGGANLIDSIDHTRGTYQIRAIGQGGNSRDLDSIAFLVDRLGNVGVGSNSHSIAEFDPEFDQELGLIKTLDAKFEVRGFGYGAYDPNNYKPALKVSYGDSDLELDSNRSIYGRTYKHDDFKDDSNTITRVFAADFAQITDHTDHNSAFILDWSHHNGIVELIPAVSQTITVILSGSVSNWNKFQCKILNLGQGTVKLNFAINAEAAMESTSIYNNIEIYNKNNAAWRAFNNQGFTGTGLDPVDTQYSRTYTILQGTSNFTGGETEAAVIISDPNLATENAEITLDISGALISGTINASAEEYVDGLYPIWREGFPQVGSNDYHYYGGAFSYIGHNNRVTDYANNHSSDNAALGWYNNQTGETVVYGKMIGTINNAADFLKYIHTDTALERLTLPAHYVWPAIRFNTNIGWIPVVILPYLSQSGASLTYGLSNFETPHLGGDESTITQARLALDVNPNKDPSDTVYDINYHEILANLYAKQNNNAYDDNVISAAHPYSFTFNLQHIEDTFGITDKSGRMTTVEFALVTAASSSVGGGLIEHSPVPIDNSDAEFATGDITGISGAYEVDMLLNFLDN